MITVSTSELRCALFLIFALGFTVGTLVPFLF
jgi:hypothetical protein